MKIINNITAAIIRNAKDGESVHSLARRIGFAYSAVYKWVSELENYDVFNIIRRGNKNIININKNLIYRKFKALDSAISIVEKDKVFWRLMKALKLKTRFIKGTAATIWTQGSFITGDFYERIYFVEVNEEDINCFKKVLKKHNIAYTEGNIIIKRPLVYITTKKEFKIEKKNGLPVMPLSELISWCKKLHLDNILEHLDLLYDLRLKVKYSEIATNI